MAADVPTIEQALLLRVPLPVAETLKKQLAEPATTTKPESSAAPRITFTTVEGQLQLQLGASQMQGQLVNLPSIIEVQKTFDSIHYYKAMDIAQMVVVVAPNPAAAAAASSSTASLAANPIRPKNTPDNSIVLPPVDFPHGLTPPTRDVRTKRYERNTKVPYRIVREVDSLLANLKDEKAVHTFELVEEDEEVEIDEEEEAAMAEDERMTDGETGETNAGDGVNRPSSIRRDTGMTPQHPSSALRPNTGLGTPHIATGSRSGAAAAASGVLATPLPHSSTRLASPHLGSPLIAPASGSGGLGSATPARRDDRTGTGMQKTMFAPSPYVTAGTDDMTDIDASVPSASPSTSAGLAASVSGINVDTVEHMFGSPGVTSGATAASAGGAGAMDFLPETPRTPIAGANLLGFPPSSAAASAVSSSIAAPPAPPSALDLLRVDLAELETRIERAQKTVTEAKNMILKKQAQMKLDAVLNEKKDLMAKIEAAEKSSDAAPAAAASS